MNNSTLRFICGDFLKSFKKSTKKDPDSSEYKNGIPFHKIEFSVILKTPIDVTKYLLLMIYIKTNLIFETIFILPIRGFLDLVLCPLYSEKRRNPLLIITIAKILSMLIPLVSLNLDLKP